MAGDAPAFLENRDEETDWRARADSEDGKAGCENEAAAVVGDTDAQKIAEVQDYWVGIHG